MEQRYDFILFDADRTLFDFDRSQRQSLREVYRQNGIPETDELLNLYVHINNRLWARFDKGEITTAELTRVRFVHFLEEAGITGPDPAALNLQYLTALSCHGELFDGAEELCRSLAPFCKEYIVTNGIALSQIGRLERSPIRKYIEKMYISEELGIRKPEAGYFERVRADIGLNDSQWNRTVIVGDGLRSDILGGRNANLDTIWYNPKGVENRTDITPTWEAATFEEIRVIILGETD
jgi:2-haloacid dehalogenase